MHFTAASLVSWLIFGAVGRVEWSDNYAGLLTIAGVVQLACLIGLAVNASWAWPSSFGVYMTSAIVGFGVTTIYIILFYGENRNACSAAFWSLSGIYLGVAVEAVTGITRRARAAWATTVELRQ